MLTSFVSGSDCSNRNVLFVLMLITFEHELCSALIDVCWQHKRITNPSKDFNRSKIRMDILALAQHSVSTKYTVFLAVPQCSKRK